MKKIYIRIVGLCFIISVLVSCKKTADVILPTASLTIYNCFTDGSILFTKFNGSENVSFSDQNNGIPAPFSFVQNNQEFGLPAGKLNLKLYAFPDSIHAVSEPSLDLKAADIRSLFITGTSIASDTLITRDVIANPPSTDSVVFFRIVNLAQTGVPMSINMVGQDPLPILQQVNYKQATGFVAFGVKKIQLDNDFFNFEVRNSIDHQLLTTFSFQWNRPTSAGNVTFLSKGITVAILKMGSDIKCSVFEPIILR